MSTPAIPARPDLRASRNVHMACILDVETTGLSYSDQVVELGLLLFAYDRREAKVLGIVDEYSGLREPTVPVHPRAASVHGITAAELKGKRLDYERVESILTRARVLIAHNAAFDRRFVAQLSDTAAERPWRCSCRGINWRARGFASGSLEDLLDGHGIATSRAHRALADVYGVLGLLATEPDYLRELLG